MKKTFTLIVLVFASQWALSQTGTTFHDYSAETITGTNLNLSQYYGKKVLVVNTASFCGYTPQFADLQSLYAQYQQYNFEIIGFPCNDFNGQDPNDDSTINVFCIANYGVTFQMMSKIATISIDTAPVYKWLQRQNLNGVANAHVSWNFNKFCIDEAGHWVDHHTQLINPLDTIITNWIMLPSVVSNVNSNHSDAANYMQVISTSDDHSLLTIRVFEKASEKIKLTIYSVDGKRMETDFSNKYYSTGTYQLNVTEFDAGLYFISATSKNLKQTLKFIVSK